MKHNFVDISSEGTALFTQVLTAASINHLLAHGQMREDELQSVMRRWKVLGGASSLTIIGKLKQSVVSSGEPF